MIDEFTKLLKRKNILFKEEGTFENSFNLFSDTIIEGKLVNDVSDVHLEN